MAIHDDSPIERALRKLLVPVFIGAGIIVLIGFFFPSFVGDVISGQYWLIVALLFFGSGLGYLTVLQANDSDDEKVEGARYLMQIRRLSLLNTIRTFFLRHDPVTFGVPVLVFLLFFLSQILFPTRTIAAVELAQGFVLDQLGLLLLVAMLIAVCYCLFLLVGPWGEIKLGGPDTEPTYTYPVYFTMFFTAGIAAGIVFWGPAEAIFHYETPPPFFAGPAESEAAINGALTYSLFHWGLSAWSAYLVIGIPIAYFVYEHGAPLRVSSILTPFLGVENLDSPWCRLVDLLAIFATIGGIATSVALVSQQFLAGVRYQWGVEFETLGALVFVAGLTLIFIMSAQSGIHRGIRRIAGLNIILFGLFAVLIFSIGPRSAIISHSTSAAGSYVVNFVPMSLYTGDAWVSDWTVSWWAWWFSWAPFAGLFLAALSRGRKIRTVVLTGLVATSAATMVWFLLLGSTSLHLQQTGVADIVGAVSAGGEDIAGYPLFSALPLSQLLIFLFLALIIVFMTSSADTSTLVVAILASKPNRAPTTGTIVFWGVVQGAVAVSVLLTGSETTLQAAAVLTGGPFALIAILALAGLTVTFLRNERGYDSILAKVPSLSFEDIYEK